MVMGALLTTVNVSCSDYDDDINGLQQQIDALVTQDQLQAKAEELRDIINSAQTDYNEKIKAVSEVAEAAKKTADDITAAAATKEELAAVAEAAQQKADEIAANAATKTELANAVETAKEFAKKLEDILGTKASKQEVLDLIENLSLEMSEALEEQQDKIDALDERLKLVETAVGQDILDDLKAISEELKAIEDELKDIIGAYSTMVTLVQLFNNTAGEYGPSAYANGFDGHLFFPEIEEKENVFPNNGETNATVSFVNGKVQTLSDSILVRVLPVDAVLTPSNISLMNSQCAELDDIIEVESVKRYSSNASPITRSGEQRSLDCEIQTKG